MPAPSPITAAPAYHRHRPEQTALYAIVAEHYPRFVEAIVQSGGNLPKFVHQEFEDYLKCGLLKHGFLRVKYNGCRHEHLVAFSCKCRGFCPSCGARRMVESAAHLVDHVFPGTPVMLFRMLLGRTAIYQNGGLRAKHRPFKLVGLAIADYPLVRPRGIRFYTSPPGRTDKV